MNAFIFVPLLAATWVIGFIILGLTAHYFLSIVESSATATAENVAFERRSFRSFIRDGVNWPDEQFFDWIWKGAYLAYLVGVWAFPAVLIGRAIAPESWKATAIAAGVMWLGFPIGVLSSLAADSRWNPLWPRLFVCLAQRPVQTLGFYALSLIPLAGLAVGMELMFLHPMQVSLAVGLAMAPVGVTALFLYARLIGRLGMVVSFTRGAEPEDGSAEVAPRRRKKPAHADDEKNRFSRPTEAYDQRADMTPLKAPEGEVTGYGVDFSGTAPAETEALPARQIHHFDDDDDAPIVMENAAALPTDHRQKLPDRLRNPPECDVAYHLRKRPTEPANPYGAEAVTFLLEPKTAEAWVKLTAAFLTLAALIRALDALRPE